jgi:hypothetical protein
MKTIAAHPALMLLPLPLHESQADAAARLAIR